LPPGDGFGPSVTTSAPWWRPRRRTRRAAAAAGSVRPASRVR